MKLQRYDIYIIRCRDKSLYTGIAKNAEERIEIHRKGVKWGGAKYLQGRKPLKIIWKKRVASKSKALKLEAGIKKLSHNEKRLLIKGKLKLH